MSIAVAAVHVVLALPAEDDVGAFALQRVAELDHVVARAGDDAIAAGAAVDRVGAVAGLAHDVRVGLAEHGVVVPPGLEQVGAGSAAQHVVAAAADRAGRCPGRRR